MPRITLEILLDEIRFYICRACPGEVPAEVRITLVSGKKIVHPIPNCPCCCPVDEKPEERPVENRQPDITPTEPEHSPDFRSISWGKHTYTFTTSQALIVQALWQAWEKRTPDVSAAHLLELAESSCERVRDLFPKHPAWGVLIKPGATRGTYRLQCPDIG